MFCLPQAAEVVELFGVNPANDAATIAGHLTTHEHPAALGPSEQRILRHPQFKRSNGRMSS
jgi:hypothetical protein